MNLKTSYINFLKQKHNSEYYLWNTYPVRFLKSETNFGEIFIVFLHDSIVLLLLTYQIKLFYNIDLYFFFIPFFIYYFFGILKYLLKKINLYGR
jgi:hypothetical protein